MLRHARSVPKGVSPRAQSSIRTPQSLVRLLRARYCCAALMACRDTAGGYRTRHRDEWCEAPGRSQPSIDPFFSRRPRAPDPFLPVTRTRIREPEPQTGSLFGEYAHKEVFNLLFSNYLQALTDGRATVWRLHQWLILQVRVRSRKPFRRCLKVAPPLDWRDTRSVNGKANGTATAGCRVDGGLPASHSRTLSKTYVAQLRVPVRGG